jgi:hypothetical protein
VSVSAVPEPVTSELSAAGALARRLAPMHGRHFQLTEQHGHPESKASM